MSAPGPVPGDVLAGKYRVERVLGSGGMGIVVLATHIQLEQKVAIKLLLPAALQSVELIRRFVQEARAAARLRGDHVVRVHDVGTLDDGNPYLVMEYLEGEDLDAVVQARGRLPIEEAVDYVLQACEAIAEAHGAGIIHRDLKPANLFLAAAPDGRRSIKVLDFGISKITPKSEIEAQSVTKTRSLMGSPLYMSPEQMRSTKTTTAKTDVWALGIILYEMLVGSPPFTGDTMPQICAMVLADPVPRLQAGRPDAPAELGTVIEMATQKDPDDRFDVASFARALAPFASAAGKVSAERVIRVAVGAPTLLSAGVDVAAISGPRSGSSASGSGSASGSVSISVAGLGSSPSIDPASPRPSGPLGTDPEAVLPRRPATLATFGTTAPPDGLRTRSLLLVATGLGGAAIIALGLYLGLRQSPRVVNAGPETPATVDPAAGTPGRVDPPKPSLPSLPSPPTTGIEPIADTAAPAGAGLDAGTRAAIPLVTGKGAWPGRAVAHPPAGPKPGKPDPDDPFDHRFSP